MILWDDFMDGKQDQYMVRLGVGKYEDAYLPTLDLFFCWDSNSPLSRTKIANKLRSIVMAGAEIYNEEMSESQDKWLKRLEEHTIAATIDFKLLKPEEWLNNIFDKACHELNGEMELLEENGFYLRPDTTMPLRGILDLNDFANWVSDDWNWLFLEENRNPDGEVTEEIFNLTLFGASK